MLLVFTGKFWGREISGKPVGFIHGWGCCLHQATARGWGLGSGQWQNRIHLVVLTKMTGCWTSKSTPDSSQPSSQCPLVGAYCSRVRRSWSPCRQGRLQTPRAQGSLMPTFIPTASSQLLWTLMLGRTLGAYALP